MGVGLALAAGAGWASFVLLSPRVAQAVGGAGLALAMRWPACSACPSSWQPAAWSGSTSALLAGALAVAILSTALPLSLEFEALQRMTARAYGIIVTLEPVAAALVGAIVLGQALPPTALLAIACVTVAAIGVTLSDRRPDGSGAAARLMSAQARQRHGAGPGSRPARVLSSPTAPDPNVVEAWLRAMLRRSPPRRRNPHDRAR